jgi:DNA processing protein
VRVIVSPSLDPELHAKRLNSDLAAWLRLLLTPGVGRDKARKLLAACGSAEGVFSSSHAARSAIVGPALATTLDQTPEGFEAMCDSTSAWLAGHASRVVLTVGDAAYPSLLLNTADPPLMLYAQGRLELLQGPIVAIVGSRNPTPQGSDNARQFARHLSQGGITVVSGLALGIDGAAHEGALEGPGSTIAVIGTGADRIYPARHRELTHRIAEQGLLLSEFTLGTPPLRENFPQRNRVIAGLALGTLVVEAALPSGSLSTAKSATEAGRDVFAIPGSIHSPQSRGCHWLIKQGAKLVDAAQDILDELQLGQRAAAAAPTAAEDTDPLLHALGHEPTTLDALLARTGESAAVLQARLMELELDGQVARLPGGLYQRRGLA